MKKKTMLGGMLWILLLANGWVGTALADATTVKVDDSQPKSSSK